MLTPSWRLLELNRRHWGAEANHNICDKTFREDAHLPRTGHDPLLAADKLVSVLWAMTDPKPGRSVGRAHAAAMALCVKLREAAAVNADLKVLSCAGLNVPGSGLHPIRRLSTDGCRDASRADIGRLALPTRLGPGSVSIPAPRA